MSERKVRKLSHYWDETDYQVTKVDGVYRQTLEERQEQLIWAARHTAREESQNPYLKADERRAIEDYAYEGIRSPIVDAFILAHKQRIYDKAFSGAPKTSQEYIEFFETIESHVPEKIKAYAIAGGHFIGIDNHAPIFVNTWKAYGEKCKRELTP